MSDNYDKLRGSNTESAPKKKPRRSPFRRAMITLVIVLLLAAVLVCAAAVWGYRISVDQHILPNTYVEGIYVGDMTREEADQALRAAGFDSLEGESLAVTLPAGAGFYVDYLRSGTVLSREQAISLAYAGGHGTNVFTNLLAAVKSHLAPVSIEMGEQPLDEAYIRSCMDEGIRALNTNLNRPAYIPDIANARLTLYKGAGGVELDTDGLYKAIETALRGGEKTLRFDKLLREPAMPNFEQIYSEVAVEPVSAWYSESFEVMPETVGVSFGVEEAVQLWQNANIGEQVIIPLTLTQPDFTAEQLEGLLFRDLLGAQMTYYTGSTSERINNIRLAAAKLDGLILLPGESFSYNDAVGKRTEEAGFQYADAYSDGQVVPELGGGICQVSSTLYSASLYARMKILSRTNHYFKVGYLDYGMDATVSWGGPDFKFRNDRELPIKIAAYLNEDENSLVVEIWGTDFDGIRVQLRTVVEPVYDDEFPDVQIGNSVTTYSDMYDLDGNYLDTSRANSGVYYFHDENIEWPDGVEKRLSDAFNTNTTPERDIYM
ncbi:MAG: VanW family protein [Oscillospiraceae bacterium]|nr:VanW family protein [Oscillospiraceae bacterium]